MWELLKVLWGRGGYVGHLLTSRAGEGLDLGWLARWRQLATVNFRLAGADQLVFRMGIRKLHEHVDTVDVGFGRGKSEGVYVSMINRCTM